jgi:hypothetical protein
MYNNAVHTILWVGVGLLIIVAITEVFSPNILSEGFQSIVSVGDNVSFISKFVPRRGDIGPEQEEKGYVADKRYFSGYTDVQRLGSNLDYCRMVTNRTDQLETFFACALGGTEGLSSLKFRSPTVRQGFELSRDDYMKTVDGRDAYCRILKTGESIFEARCNVATDTGFRTRTIIDPNPSEDIQELLRAYQGIVFWLRLRDDMIDYAKNLQISVAGLAHIDEFPPLRNPSDGPARTLELNGVDQFLRIGDNSQLEFGNTIDLRYLRAVTFWVYFEEFTNNAHIFDFGNGAGKDNVWCGILGRGNSPLSASQIRPTCTTADQTTVPQSPSGQQPVLSMSPQQLMESSPANINDFSCPKPQIYGRIMQPTQPHSMPPHEANTADLVYEIWDHQQRKMHCQVKNAIHLREWTHVVITARNTDAFRPDLDFYINGTLVYTEAAAWLPQASTTTRNYVGKSNWQDVTSPFQNADELFKGRIYDFRGYRVPLPSATITAAYKSGRIWLQKI